MKLAKGNMWTVWNKGMFIVTTNSYIKNGGRLVMGAGIAKQARNRLTGVDLKLGSMIRDTCGHLGFYGFLPVSSVFGAFQVKYDWIDSADLDLIKRSTSQLADFATQRPEMTFNLNFPGIGNGRLARNIVLPIIETLPDNVTVWELK